MNEKNRLKTCKKCHSGKKDLPLATAGFLTFSPHGNSHDFEHYPPMWLTTKFMVALLIGVFVFFWAHSGLWWYREYKDRQDPGRAPQAGAHAEELPPLRAWAKHFRRLPGDVALGPPVLRRSA